jgi:hypothetical protein
MIASRKGVIGLPVKLAVSFMIVALMVPSVIMAVDDIQEGIESRNLTASGEKLAARIADVSHRNDGYLAHMELSVPGEGYLEIGGDEGYCIRVMKDGKQIGRVLTETPIISSRIVLSGDMILELRNSSSGVTVEIL